jgi:predicted Fe-Mo cluster-binding NifX family protein
MKVCIPVAAKNGRESEVYGHFGSAPVFALHDTESGETTYTDNANQDHAHGACHPMQALDGKTVEALVVGGIGARAVARLNESGIRVYRAGQATLGDVVDELVKGALDEITVDDACAGHGGCSH